VTPSERRALVFLAAVAALGVGTRAVRGRGAEAPPALEARAALARQIAVVDSVRDAGRSRAGRGRARRRGAAPTPVRPRAVAPPLPDESSAIVDLDVADSATIERLPRIGPTLAARIVADRAARGPFGSPAGLERVRGIGPALSKLLAPRVTFSGTGRPTSAELGRAPPAPPSWRRPSR
jgi:competence protein ComEA